VPETYPHDNTNLREVASRNDAATRIIAGFSAELPSLADVWRFLEAALADVPALSAEVARLSAEVRDTRLDRADLLAAARSTLAAYADGEDDPLSYIRDELSVRRQLPPNVRGHHDQLPEDAAASAPDPTHRHATHDVRQLR
jgi:hypothetical protein